MNVKTLKIDKDCFVDEEWIAAYANTIIRVCESYNLTVEAIKMCNSKKKGIHFYVEVNPCVEAVLANMLQWLLGDDCRRVDFNRARIESGLTEWNKLFEVANRKLKTVYRRNLL